MPKAPRPNAASSIRSSAHVSCLPVLADDVHNASGHQAGNRHGVFQSHIYEQLPAPVRAMPAAAHLPGRGQALRLEGVVPPDADCSVQAACQQGGCVHRIQVPHLAHIAGAGIGCSARRSTCRPRTYQQWSAFFMHRCHMWPTKQGLASGSRCSSCRHQQRVKLRVQNLPLLSRCTGPVSYIRHLCALPL